jgi:hypothetical protein
MFFKKFNKVPFLQVDNKDVIEKMNLTSKRIYAYSKTRRLGSFHLMASYSSLESFILNNIFKGYSNIPNNYVDIEKKFEGISFILVTQTPKTKKGFLSKYLEFVNHYTKSIDFKICVISEEKCKYYLKRIGHEKFPMKSLPLGFAYKAKKDIFYIFKDGIKRIGGKVSFKPEELTKFLDNILSKKLRPSTFSQKSLETPQSLVSKANFNNITKLIHYNSKRLVVVLFYDSRECHVNCSNKYANKYHCTHKNKKNKTKVRCDSLLENYYKLAKKMIKKKHISESLVDWRTYDIGQNSYQQLELGKVPFLRFYYGKSIRKYEDLEMVSGTYRWYSQVHDKIVKLGGNVDSEL